MRIPRLAFLLAVACQSPAVLTAPEGLSYEGAPFALTVGVGIGDGDPSFTGGGAATEFMISKTLPAGLSFSAATGVISGTPTAAANNSVYTVVASNEAGTASINFELRVEAIGDAPTMLTYPVTDVSYLKGAAIATNTPTVQGTMPMTFSVAPMLPAGLSISPTTGAISGTPTASQAKSAFEVTATNAKGNTSAVLQIGVVDQATAPVITGYTAATATYVTNQQIVRNAPVLSGTPPFTFAVDKALPAGLSFSTTDGAITGTPTAVVARDSFVVTATNSAGMGSFTVSIRVVATAMFSYPSTHFQFFSPGTGIGAIAPTVLPTGIDPLTVTPTLPAGLTLNTATGEVKGSPSRTFPLAETVYTVTATDTVSRETVTATFNLELRVPATPSAATPAGVGANGILIDVTDSFDGLNCKAAGASVTPSTGAIAMGQVITFRLASAPFHGWTNAIAQANAGGDVWPSLPCLLLGNLGSTCTFGVNHPVASYSYTNSHSAQSCPDTGTITVN